MGKMLKVVVLLAVLVIGVLLFLQYSNKKKSDTPTAAQRAPQAEQPKAKKEGIEVQEKYGFAPAGQ